MHVLFLCQVLRYCCNIHQLHDTKYLAREHKIATDHGLYSRALNRRNLRRLCNMASTTTCVSRKTNRVTHPIYVRLMGAYLMSEQDLVREHKITTNDAK